MKKLLIAAFVVVFGTVSAYAACSSNEIDVNGDGTNCQTAHFSIGTTNIPANGTFTFKMSAGGTFYVDCGNGGTLSGSGVSGKTIVRSDTNEATYTCTYSSAGTKTIRFGGVATHYSTDYPAISFQDNSYVLSVDGNMSAMFPVLGSDYERFLWFSGTFRNCTNLTSISETLFSNYTRALSGMFGATFEGCTGLTSIPSDLFANITNAYSGGGEFSGTFQGCTGLTALPAGLFRNITNAGGGTFAYTFQDCTNLSGYIPGDMFAGLIANGSPGANDDVMYQTFKGDSGLAGTCPAGTTLVETPYSQYWDGKVACSNIELTSTTYVQNRISGLQNKFEGLGANKLMTFGTQAGQVSNRDIVTTLGTPNASGIYSNTSDTSVPTIGAINSAVIAKQDLLNGTTGFAIAGTGTPGELSEKPIYSLQVGPDSLIEAGTLNTAVVDAVNSEMTQINENGEADPNGTLWRINDVITLLNVGRSMGLAAWVNAQDKGGCHYGLSGESIDTSGCSVSGYGEWGIELGEGTRSSSNTLSVRGISACSSVPAYTIGDIVNNQSGVQDDYEHDQNIAPTTEASGEYCYCKMTNPQNASAPWVYFDKLDDAKNCSDSCANNCKKYLINHEQFNYLRSALFGLNSGVNLINWLGAGGKGMCFKSLDGDKAKLEDCQVSNYADWGVVLAGKSNNLTITGISTCSANDGKEFTQADIQSDYDNNMRNAPNNNPSGQYCYCKLTNPQSGTAQWIYETEYKNNGHCANECARSCAELASGAPYEVFGMKN